ncbi:HNH endonuclease family protein [Amylibacter sp.]|nr:HNH endonuclease family protein [Amylibacter sp.]
MFKTEILKTDKICFLVAVFLLSLTTPSNAENIPAYDRGLFGSWKDFDNDCQNTRHELLQILSLDEFTLTDNTCRVLTGLWLDPYTNMYFSMSSELDIDHLVPLKYAWTRGAYNWPKSKRVKFSNDESNLFAVKKSVNRQKSAMGPAMWLPPSDNFKCEYIKLFQEIVTKYDLRQADDELSEIDIKMDKFCVN